MQPEVVGELVNAAIPFCGGIYATLLGFRILGKRPGVSPQFDEWHRRFGGMFKVAGPLLVLFGLFLASNGIAQVARSARPTAPADWQRYNHTDESCSAEFPHPPKEDTQAAQGIVSHRLSLSLPGQDIYYTLSYSDIPPDASFGTDEERLDAIRENIPIMGAQAGLKYEFVREERLTEDDAAGRDMEFKAGSKHTSRTRVFVQGSRIYRVIAVTPQEKTYDAGTERFLKSFRLGKRTI